MLHQCSYTPVHQNFHESLKDLFHQTFPLYGTTAVQSVMSASACLSMIIGKRSTFPLAIHWIVGGIWQL